MLNVCIIGLGQIGGSLGLALRKSGAPYYITGIVRKKNSLKAAVKLKIVNEVSLTLESAKNANIVVICTPVDTILPLYKQLSGIVNKEAVITDVGSVKYLIEKGIKSCFVKNDGISFVGVHPMAGKEKNGIFSADADMFKNANVVITGPSKELTRNETLVAQMWKYAGANIVKMSAKKHDDLIAFTSHLPHIIAFLLKKIYKKTMKKSPQINILTAGSFQSMTRVAVSSADMWAPIFEANGKNIEKYLSGFIKELNDFKLMLKNKQKIKKEILYIQK
jgi:prephenate dehydrogenase